MLRTSVFGAAGAAVLALTPATAQSPESQTPQPQGWSISVGGGVLASPGYLGDDDQVVSALPYIRVANGDRFFASVQEGLVYRVVNADGWRAGPRLSLDFGRDEEDGGNPFRIAGDDTTDLVGLGEIDASLALGGFVERDLGPLTARLDVRQALGGHEGMIGEAGLNWRTRLGAGGPPTFVSIGPRATFADGDYHEAFFGVNAAQSVASGLTPYEAGSGLVSYGVGASVVRPITRQLTLVGLAGFDRLADDAADSSLVQERGSEDQAVIGAFVAYRLN